MHEDREYGFKNPHKTLVALATDSTCPICGEKPCTIITMASILVLQADTVKTTVSAINYSEGLKSLKRHIRGHSFGASHRLWEANRPPTSWVTPKGEEVEASNGQHLRTENKDPPETKLNLLEPTETEEGVTPLHARGCGKHQSPRDESHRAT